LNGPSADNHGLDGANYLEMARWQLVNMVSRLASEPTKMRVTPITLEWRTALHDSEFDVP